MENKMGWKQEYSILNFHESYLHELRAYISQKLLVGILSVSISRFQVLSRSQ